MGERERTPPALSACLRAMGKRVTETFMWEHKIKKKKARPRALQLADKNAACL